MGKLLRRAGDKIWEKHKVPALIREVYKKHFFHVCFNIKDFKVIDTGNYAFFISDYHARDVFSNYEFTYNLGEYLTTTTEK